ncbi:Ubiquitin carboxyl-terminal hydrolase isozyme L5 [Galemys pyrenaicus]|uniref:ubiquitinyl hydrolase 1 n=1 Tax=Galemys pyrenaicus TaxID=202257 RepID=A0A8J6AEC0_GALPY|nr:Ubiquitin carboxyl-terminal hydrolase isozyme L5 [Galemys pyrenaicus]
MGAASARGGAGRCVAGAMTGNAGEWCLMESDPGVFTELIKGFGESQGDCPGPGVTGRGPNCFPAATSHPRLFEGGDSGNLELGMGGRQCSRPLLSLGQSRFFWHLRGTPRGQGSCLSRVSLCPRVSALHALPRRPEPPGHYCFYPFRRPALRALPSRAPVPRCLGPPVLQGKLECGCRGAQVEEIWSLEPENFEKLKPVHGLIFLFKWQPGEEPAGSVVQDSRLDTIFFAKQVINNACATQAIVSVLLNCTHQDVHLGETLSEFKEFSQSFDAAMKGLALSNSDVIRQVHNSFARQQMFEFDAKTTAKEEDAFHFVSYVPVNGRLYELDGLREGPIDLGACNQDDWISAVRPVIEKRIQKYSEGEIRFNLMAIVSDRKMIYEQKIAELQRQLAEEEPMDTDQGNNMLSAIQSEVAKNQMLIEEEVQKLKRYKVCF